VSAGLAPFRQVSGRVERSYQLRASRRFSVVTTPDVDARFSSSSGSVQDFPDL